MFVCLGGGVVMRGASGGWSDGADFGDGTGGLSFAGGVLESSAESMTCDAK